MCSRIRRIFICWIVSLPLLAIAGSGCGTSSPFDGDACTPGVANECPPVTLANGGTYAQFCLINEIGPSVCTNVCDFAANQLSNGGEGDFCVFDSDCGQDLTCDNDTVGAVMPCLCIPEMVGTGGTGGSGVSDCSDVTPGNGEFGAPCRNNADCLDGLPCCTSTEVSEACGVEVGLCECI
ncbi:MAG: hypothetical protein OES69_10245 [Myxococcales bacterium]|nr:hypothetical protein [Myxococcales bacterium]MDH3844308.1 hypothetical protein [Myxococcales bacterium]